MYQNERLELILGILKKNGYTTVKYLTEQLHYSNATVNRDLALLEARKLVKRSYGGVELEEKHGVPLVFRYHKMKPSKMKVAKRAAELIDDGDTVFIDASTTTQYIGHYLEGKRDITVITNNMALAMDLGAAGVEVVCLGGRIIETPSMLSGVQTVENAKRLHADKMFFSTGGIDSMGNIMSSEVYYLLHTTMAENSRKVYYLLDRDKLNASGKLTLFDLSEVDGVISDFDLKAVLKKEFDKTEFILAK